MVATDTVVGVVGAVLLAAVMVGVFVYEYNNAPAGPANEDAAQAVTFKANYPDLAAEGDLDGDGTLNFKDADMDNNGVPDVNQTGDLVVRKPISAQSLAPPATTGQAHSEAFMLAEGVKSVRVYANYTTALPAQPPLPAPPRTPTLELQALAGSEPADATPASTQAGTTVQLTLDLNNPTAGNYTLAIQQTTPGPQTAITGGYVVSYGHAQPKPVGP